DYYCYSADGNSGLF
nr:immunoglobulin light chain junction region [Macaca mulatta]MOX80962.1 immunoglobulin light chain junction region [Macaca mulatta]MOX81867.1 immunoglobulin light chain junction region [Macaca mulatta]MOX82053.1 immunoglobulin light chain junction region [Macaca mulatta]MOX82133.1 immunoglobulin light chain junction region [Macaca mulatta]